MIETVCRFVLVWVVLTAAIYGLMTLGQLAGKVLEQQQLQRCIEKPWLAAAKDC
jgi:hypothetical protein